MVRGTCGVDAEAELNLPPGFRFYPTDEELVVHYLCRKAAHQRLPVPIIAEVDLYHYDPWQLPEKALFGQREWYFFTPRSRKYPKGSRPNRAAGGGYWKATGADKPISLAGRDVPRPLGIKKSLVFYAGRSPTGVKTNWIMHEYRLAGSNHAANKKPSGSLRLDDWVLCRLYNKKNTWGQEQRRPRPEVASGAGETTQDTCSGSLRTLESDVDNDVNTTESGRTRHGNPFGAGTLARQLVIPNTAHATGVSASVGGDDQGAGRIKKEDGDDSWFGVLNLDGPGSSPVASMDLLHEEYLAALALPQLKPGHGTLPPF